MTKPFSLTDLPNRHWAVYWDGNKQDIKEAVYKEKLLLSVFRHTDADTVGFSIRLNGGEHDTLWIDRIGAYSASTNYSEYIQDMYVIDGVAFKNHNDAVKYYDWLEKQYIWQVLQT